MPRDANRGHRIDLAISAIESRGTYLYVIVTGGFDLKAAENVFVEVLDAEAEHCISRALIDCRSVDGGITTLERFYYATFASEEHLRRRLSGKLPPCAFAFVGNEPLIDPRRFGETVLLNHGVRAKVTVSFDAALVWLLAQEIGDYKRQAPP